MNQKVEEYGLAVQQQGEILDAKNEGIVVKDGSLDYENFVGLWRLSKLLVMSGMVPKVKDGTSLEERTSQIAVSIARGRCVGLDAFQSVESIVPINGRPMIWGNAPLAIARQSPAWDESGFDEYWEVKGQRQDSHPAKFDDDSITAVCQTMRKGAAKPMVRRFSIADAKRAGLWGSTGKLYGAYPQRMLPARARAYNLNDNFGDSLKGIQIRESFDEEVDGKRVEEPTNGDQLRQEVEKRKKDTFPKGSPLSIPNVEPVGRAPEHHRKPTSAENIQNAMKQSFPEKEFNPNKGAAVMPSELDEARQWLHSVLAKADPAKKESFLKDASIEDGSWIAEYHIDSISDTEYLKRIAANLEDALREVKA